MNSQKLKSEKTEFGKK